MWQVVRIPLHSTALHGRTEVLMILYTRYGVVSVLLHSHWYGTDVMCMYTEHVLRIS